MISSVSQTPIKRNYFQHKGLRLSYLDNEQETNEPPIIMIHGFTANADINWLQTQWITMLTQAGRRVIAVDARGHGDSDKPYDNTFYLASEMLSDVCYLLDELAIARADFAGFSMGARISALMAINHADKVAKLLLGGMGIHLKTGMQDPKPIADALLADSLKNVKERYARRFRRLAERGNNDLVALSHCILSSRQAISAQELTSISANTLILLGAQDEIAGDPYPLQALIKNSQVCIIDDCNHFNALGNANFRQAGVDFLCSL